MADISLNDLKQNSIKLEEDSSKDESGFVPSVSQNDDIFIPTVTQEEELFEQPTIQQQPNRMVINTSAGVNGKRVRANISELVKEKKDENVKVSPVDEILKPGGDFEKYIEKKKAIALQEIRDWEEEQELSENTSPNLVETESNEEDDTDLDFEDEDQVSNSNKNYNIGIVNEDFDMEEDKEEELKMEDSNIKTIKPEMEDAKEEKVAEETEILEEPKIIMVDSNETESSYDDEIEFTNSEVADTDDDIDYEENIQVLKDMITQKIKPISKKLDISGFTIAAQVSTSRIAENTQTPAAKWALPNSGVVITMRDFSGSDLEDLKRLSDDGRNTDPDVKATLQMIYDHIVSPKPDFTKWLKSICAYDYDHLFFAIYIASFTGANYIPVDCTNPNCKGAPQNKSVKTFLTDNIVMQKMVKYKDDEAKEKFISLLKSDAFECKGNRAVKVIPVSDKYAIGFAMPSLYHAIIEMKYFDEKFAARYTNTINISPFIHNIYEIDYDNKQLKPIAYKIFDNNPAKTAKARIKRYDEILKTLTADEYVTISAVTSELSTKANDVTYQIPETICPYCGHKTEAVDELARSLVFTRNRLGALMTL